MHRDADGFAVILLSVGKIAFLEAHLLVIRLGMHRDVVQVDHDVFGTQGFEHLAVAGLDAVELQANDIQMVGTVTVRVLPRKGERQVAQEFVVAPGNLVAALDVSVQSRHLAGPQYSLDVGHSVIEAQRHLLVIPRPVHGMRHQIRITGDAVAAQKAQTGGQRVVVRHGHATFARGDDFDGVETKNGDVTEAAVANGLALVLAPNGVGGVFDDLEAVLLAQRMNGGHVAGLACQVHRHHHFGQLVGFLGLNELGLQLLGAKVVRARVGVNKVNLCAAVQSAVGRGDKCIGRGPKPISRPKIQSQTGHVQGCGRVADSETMLSACVLDHTLLKLCDGRALRQIIGLQHSDHCIDVRWGDVLATIADHDQILPILSRWPSIHACRSASLIHSVLLSLE